MGLQVVFLGHVPASCVQSQVLLAYKDISAKSDSWAYKPGAVHVTDEPARVVGLARVLRRRALWVAGVDCDAAGSGDGSGRGHGEDCEELHNDGLIRVSECFVCGRECIGVRAVCADDRGVVISVGRLQVCFLYFLERPNHARSVI